MKAFDLEGLHELERRQVQQLADVIIAAGVGNTVPIRWVPGDAPHIGLRNGHQLCSDSLGGFDVWRNDDEPLWFGLTLAEAVTLLKEQTP